MDILLLIVVLVLLILVHELGHFIVAKLSGMRVDEFGIGYPPRAYTLFKKGDTSYTLNWLPFGGFVKIYDEDGGEKSKDGKAFSDKNRFLQALALIAGVAMNVLFAWALISGTLYAGTPRALDESEIARATDAAITISDVLPDSPAEEAGIQVGDRIVRAITPTETFSAPDPVEFTNFIAKDRDGTPITLDLVRNGEELLLSVIPTTNIVPGESSRPALGVAVAVVGTVPLSGFEALTLGAHYTWEITKLTAIGLTHFFASIFTFSADFSQISGPVGIAGAVGSASAAGFSSLVSLTAIISINLALINLIPVPALDGGRLLFVIIESITRRRIPHHVSGMVNTIGFGLLILLMVAVTVSDIWRIVA